MPLTKHVLGWYDSPDPAARTRSLELWLSHSTGERGKLFESERPTPADVWPAATLLGKGVSRTTAARIAKNRMLVADVPAGEPFEPAPLDHRSYSELYADWRADRITDAAYRTELRRRIAVARIVLAGSVFELSVASCATRGRLLADAAEAARGEDHRRVGELVGEALAGLVKVAA